MKYDKDKLRGTGAGYRAMAPWLSGEFWKLLRDAGIEGDIPVLMTRAVDDADPPSRGSVSVPVELIALAAGLLLNVPGVKRGPPRKNFSFAEFSAKLATDSVRGRANIIAAQTGEPLDRVRSRLRAQAKRLKKMEGIKSRNSTRVRTK